MLLTDTDYIADGYNPAEVNTYFYNFACCTNLLHHQANSIVSLSDLYQFAAV